MLRLMECFVLVTGVCALTGTHGEKPFVDSLPAIAQKFYYDLSLNESHVIEKLALVFVKNWEDDPSTALDNGLAAVKNVSETLYVKTKNLREGIEAKIQKLSPAAAAFVEDVLDASRTVVTEFAKISTSRDHLRTTELELKKQYERISNEIQNLPTGVKAELTKTFPESMNAFEREDVKKSIEKIH